MLMPSTGKWIYVPFIGWINAPSSFPTSPSLSAGAIFTEEQKDSSTELAFKYAVYRINKDKTLLPKTTLVYDIQYVPKDDSFRTAKIGKYICYGFCSPVSPNPSSTQSAFGRNGVKNVVSWIYSRSSNMGLTPISSLIPKHADNWNLECRLFLGRAIHCSEDTSNRFVRPSTYRILRPESSTSRSRSSR